MNDITESVFSFIWDQLEKREFEARVNCWDWWDNSAEIAYKDLKEDPDHGHPEFIERFEDLEKQVYYEGYKNINWFQIEHRIDKWIEEEKEERMTEIEIESSSSDNSPQTSDSE